MNRFSRFIRYAFGVDKTEYDEIDEEEKKLLERLAKGIVSRHLSAPAIMFLEPMKPLNFIGSQAMAFFRPIISAVFPIDSYERIEKILEKREGIEWMLIKIEEFENESKPLKDKKVTSK